MPTVSDAMAALCPYCGHRHATKCPLVKAFEYYPDGTAKRVEFYAPNDYPPFGLAPGLPMQVTSAVGQPLGGNGGLGVLSS